MAGGLPQRTRASDPCQCDRASTSGLYASEGRREASIRKQKIRRKIRKCLVGWSEEGRARLLSVTHNDKTRGTKLKYRKYHSDVIKTFLL